MTYVGAVPTTGDFKKLDAITASATATYNLRQSGVAVYPQSSSHCLVVLNGILQTGGSSFNIVNDTIVFAEALTSSDVINQILVLGNVNDIGVPSDDTVSTAKIQADAINATKIADDSISDEHLDITAITGQTAITSLADTDKFLVSQASDSGNLKYVEKQYLPSGTLVKLAQVDNSTSSSAVSSITLDHFSTTYDYYRFFATMGADTTGADWRVRFRDGGSDVTASYYVYISSRAQINSGGTASVHEGHAGFFDDKIIFANNSTDNTNQKVVCDWTFATGTGNSANRLQLMGNVASYRVDDVAKVGTLRGYQNAQSSNFYEGFKIYLSSGNIRYYNYALYGVVK